MALRRLSAHPGGFAAGLRAGGCDSFFETDSMRADQLLVDQGLAASRAQAQRLIASGVEWRTAATGQWQAIKKNSEDLAADAELRLLDVAEARYVSRGGLKLEGALAAFKVSAAGKWCLDVGQSTGGFTDCLLQQGAERVVGVDVGHDQLNLALRGHEKIVCLERVNARTLDAETLLEAGAFEGAPDDSQQFGLIVGDLSFISQTLVLPAVVPFLAPEGDLLMLVKPQFELQPEQIGKGGMVRDKASYAVVEKRIRECLAELGLEVRGWIDSPITGGDGNREFFVHARRSA